MKTPFLDLVVDTWTAQASSGMRYTVKRSPDNAALIVSIETSGVLATIEVWEAARCVDITTLNVDTKQGTIHAAGETMNDDEMRRRLSVLRQILSTNEVPHTL